MKNFYSTPELIIWDFSLSDNISLDDVGTSLHTGFGGSVEDFDQWN